MQMSTTRHSSTISIVLAGVSLISSGGRSAVLAAATCMDGVSGGCTGDESGNVSSTDDAGSAEASAVLSATVFATGSAVGATSALATALTVAACGAFARWASAMREGE